VTGSAANTSPLPLSIWRDVNLLTAGVKGRQARLKVIGNK